MRSHFLAPFCSLMHRLRHWRASQRSLLLSDQIARLRWLLPLFALLLVIAHQTIEQLVFPEAIALRLAAAIFIYGLLGPLTFWLAMGWIKRQVARKEKAEAELTQAHADLTFLNRRITFLLHVNQRLGTTGDEDSLAALTLQLPGEAVPAVVSSAMVRFDDQHQPMPVDYRGVLDETMLAGWHHHLSSLPVRQRCEACQLLGTQVAQDCPALQSLPLDDVGSIVCQPLARNGREFGILGMFLSTGYKLKEEEQELLHAITAEISTAFENVRLRTRELATFYDMNETLHLRLDLDGLLSRILSLTMETGNADAGLLAIKDESGDLAPCASVGDWAAVDGLALATDALRESSGQPVLTALREGIGSILCAPMMSDVGALGVIALRTRQAPAALQRQIRLISAIAAQAALLAQNARLYAQLENQAILAERGRLAREMHDGLAQTLGYLKMRARQISRWVAAGQTKQASSALQELADTADSAYLDLRAALDGLRLTPSAEPSADFSAQLRRCVADFETQSGQTVALSLDADAAVTLTLAAQAHLLRIVQEALTNIRKHAHAARVSLALSKDEYGSRLLIEDDGAGFDAGGDQPETHHGLRMMRERAGLLGAEFQVTSAPGKGTKVIILVLLKEGKTQSANLANLR